QTQLIGFFINPPLAMLSGGLTPIEAMPKWVQPVTFLNPIAHFSTIARSVLIKGAGLETVYPNLLALLALATLFVGISAWRFRSQRGGAVDRMAASLARPRPPRRPPALRAGKSPAHTSRSGPTARRPRAGPESCRTSRSSTTRR